MESEKQVEEAVEEVNPAEETASESVLALGGENGDVVSNGEANPEPASSEESLSAFTDPVEAGFEENTLATSDLEDQQTNLAVAEEEDPAVVAMRKALAHEELERRLAVMKFIDDMSDRYWVIKGESLLKTMESIREELPNVIADQSRPVNERIEGSDQLQEKLDELYYALMQHKSQVSARVSHFSEQPDNLASQDQALIEEKSRNLQVRVNRMVENMVDERVSALPKAKSYFGWIQVAAILIVVAAVGIGNYFLSLQSYNRAIATSNVQLLVETAALYQASGENEEAIRVLDEAVASGISDPKVMGWIGDTYRLLREYEKAINMLQRAIAIDPNNESYLLPLARAFNSNGSLGQALNIYEKLIALKPLSTSYLYEASQIQRKIKDYDGALAKLTRLISNNPRYYQGFFLMAEIYREQEMFDDAIAQYNSTLAVRPNLYSGFIGLGKSYVGKVEYNQAINNFLLASSISPEQAEPYFLIGEAHVAMADFEKAIESYNQALTLDDKYVSAYLGLGKIYAAQGDCENAIPQFETVLIYTPGDMEATQALQACTNSQP